MVVPLSNYVVDFRQNKTEDRIADVPVWIRGMSMTQQVEARGFGLEVTHKLTFDSTLTFPGNGAVIQQGDYVEWTEIGGQAKEAPLLRPRRKAPFFIAEAMIKDVT